MRLGAHVCQLNAGSLAETVYGVSKINERHRHRYEVNPEFVNQLESAGLVVSGRSIDGKLIEVIELPAHPWFLGCQFHPEFQSTPRKPHPIFVHFVMAAHMHVCLGKQAK